MKYRLLLDNEVKEAAHLFFIVGEDMEKRLKALYEDGHGDDKEAKKRAVAESTKLLALFDVKSSTLVLRDINSINIPVDCDCHRLPNVDESELLHKSMDNYSDAISHLFQISGGQAFAYLEQLAREMLRISLTDGQMYFGTSQRQAKPAMADTAAATN